MKIETLSRKDTIPDNCVKCRKALSKIYCRYEDSEYKDDTFDLKVFKCPECNTMYAYWVDNSYFDSWLAEEMSIPEPTGNQPLDSHGRAFPKPFARAYTKAISEHEDRSKDLNRLMTIKLPELYRAGLSLETINSAKHKVIIYSWNNKPSPKGIAKLFAAAIYVAANGVTTNGGLWKHQGEGITEEQLEQIFGVTRKTIRKWAKTLEEDFSINHTH
jgi:hypothetical protein